MMVLDLNSLHKVLNEFRDGMSLIVPILRGRHYEERYECADGLLFLSILHGVVERNGEELVGPIVNM